MKTNYITSALRNATSPAARLAAWQNPGYGGRPSIAGNLATIREAKYRGDTLAARRASLIASQGPELSSPDASAPLLWCKENSPEVETATPGRTFLDHKGWYADEFQDETLETYAVTLARFPRLVFYAVKDSCNGDLRVRLDEWQEIDFSDCQSDYDAENAREETARDVIRSNDSSTQREAEESIEFYRKDRVENDLAENRESLKNLRHEIRDLCGELKALCPSPMVKEFPAAAKAVRQSLAALLADRRRIMAENETLAASL